MKIIDEKGRLFGKINVIDFLAVLFLLSLTPMFYFGYKLYLESKKTLVALREQAAEQSEPKILQREFMEVDLSFYFNKLKPEVLNLISVGDKEIDGDGRVIAEILYLGETKPLIYEVDTAEGKTIFREHPHLKNMSAVLRLKTELKEGILYYKNKPLLSSLINFKTDKYEVKASYIPRESELFNKITALEKKITETGKEDNRN